MLISNCIFLMLLSLNSKWKNNSILEVIFGQKMQSKELKVHQTTEYVCTSRYSLNTHKQIHILMLLSRDTGILLPLNASITTEFFICSVPSFFMNTKEEYKAQTHKKMFQNYTKIPHEATFRKTIFLLLHMSRLFHMSPVQFKSHLPQMLFN
jgi:hypothetical protein